MIDARPLTVLVLAVGGNVSQGILKALAHSRRVCRIIGADISALQMGLFTVDRAYVSPWANSPDFLPWLLEICRRESVDAIFSGAEAVLITLARHRAYIEQESGAFCLVSDREVMEIGDDKLKTCEWLAGRGLPHPAFAPAEAPDDVMRLLMANGYPLVAKPRCGGGSRGLIKVENEEDLTYACRKRDYLLQAHVGTEEEEYTVGCFMDRDGTLAPSCCMRRELLAGTTYRAVLGEFSEVRAVAEAIVSALKPLGPCNVQLRLTANGPVCFEINPRFSGSAPIRAHFGYNEAEAALKHFVLGTPVTLPLVTEGVGLRYWNELYPDPDAVAALETRGELLHPAGHDYEIEHWGSRREAPKQ